MNKNKEIVEDTIAHYGVLGMKWGVRRNRTSSSDHIRSRELKKKKLSELTDEELRTLNNRLNLEQNYKRLNPSAIDIGAKLVGGYLQRYGNQVIKNLAKASGTKTADSIINGLSKMQKAGG